MFIYLVTNQVHGKVYVGQTTRSIEERFADHVRSARTGIETKLARAIRKYGVENFTIEVIDTASSREELNKKEIFWIEAYNSIKNRYGYNIAIGGSGGNTFAGLSADRMSVIGHKISTARKGSTPHNKGKSNIELYGEERAKELAENHSKVISGRKQSEETIQRRAESNTGKKRTPESKLRSSLAQKGRPSPLRGKGQTPEHRANTSRARKNYFLKRKFNVAIGEAAKVISEYIKSERI